MSIIDTSTNETLIERAIENGWPVSFRYYRDEDLRVPLPEPPKRRTVSPYELKEGKDGKTLLVCWSHSSEGIRYFEVERIHNLQSEADNEEYVQPVERG